ncbi:ferrous iron transport protein A [Clostridium sp. BJN0013]|uniref:ferrous iron transport protein A n=1 Tax=Clostridium sp. BJN0013 TaxID=3236840 RepID=UPI0034C69731
MLKLNNVPIGSYVTIDNLLSTGMLRERMLALGLTKGATIEVVRKGPSGDPTVYNIRGAMIALRNEESSLILVNSRTNSYENRLSSKIRTNII